MENTNKTAREELTILNIYGPRVSSLLQEIGMDPTLKGFNYFLEAVEICLNEHVDTLTKQIYPSIAEKYGTTAQSVERNMRYAVRAANKTDEWEKLKIGSTNTDIIMSVIRIVVFCV